MPPYDPSWNNTNPNKNKSDRDRVIFLFISLSFHLKYNVYVMMFEKNDKTRVFLSPIPDLPPSNESQYSID